MDIEVGIKWCVSAQMEPYKIANKLNIFIYKNAITQVQSNRLSYSEPDFSFLFYIEEDNIRNVYFYFIQHFLSRTLQCWCILKLSTKMPSFTSKGCAPTTLLWRIIGIQNEMRESLFSTNIAISPKTQSSYPMANTCPRLMTLGLHFWVLGNVFFTHGFHSQSIGNSTYYSLITQFNLISHSSF